MLPLDPKPSWKAESYDRELETFFFLFFGVRVYPILRWKTCRKGVLHYWRTQRPKSVPCGCTGRRESAPVHTSISSGSFAKTSGKFRRDSDRSTGTTRPPFSYARRV